MSGRRNNHVKEGFEMAMERWRPFGTADQWEPFRNMSDIQGEVNRLFDSFLGRRMPSAPAMRAWLPAVDMHETKDALVLTVEVPGVSEKDVTVSITGDLLSIKGERRVSDEAKDQQSLHSERVFGQFERLIQLPLAVQADKVEANYRDGVLQVTLPKAEELKPREIKIDIQ
jgi:HSP20 family protein